MCYLVTGIGRGSARFHAIYDTEAEAKSNAERLAREDMKELALWKQVATLGVEQIVAWKTGSEHP
jgi:hypothetical protein